MDFDLAAQLMSRGEKGAASARGGFSGDEGGLSRGGGESLRRGSLDDLFAAIPKTDAEGARNGFLRIGWSRPISATPPATCWAGIIGGST